MFFFVILFLGFSFGGLLASAVAASVWDTPYISSDLLNENMTCITFGQPLVSVDVIHKVVRTRPEMVKTIHAILTEQDQIPSLMSLFDECWSQKSQQAQNKSSVHVSVAVTNVQTAVSSSTCLKLVHVRIIIFCSYNVFTIILMLQPFEDQTTCDLLQKFAKLQNESSPPVRPCIVIIIKLYSNVNDCNSMIPYFVCSNQMNL